MDIKLLGLNSTKEKQFHKKGIYTVEDLLKYFPRKYNDYRVPKLIVDFEEDENTAIVGEVLKIKENKEKQYVSAMIADASGDVLEIYWFRTMFVSRMLIVGSQYIFMGKVTKNSFNNKFQMNNPEFSYEISKNQKIHPIYSKVKGMSDSYLKDKIKQSLDMYRNEEFLDIDIIKEYKILRTFEMARSIHHPKSFEELKKAEDRVVFDSLFELAYNLGYDYQNKDHSTSIVVEKANSVKLFQDSIPFSLTDGEGGQLQVVREIFKKMRKGKKTSSLVQGDVGCGKTMVAILLMLILAENGYQSVLMAPTNILAKQHFDELTERLNGFGFVKTVFLNGKMKAKEKREALAKIKSGEANLIIGTHSVISKDVEFCNLGVSIVDEEHRFGVAQRKLIKEKTLESIHTVTMSATPIPRSLAMSLYGDGTDVYSITQMPSGRKKIETRIETNINKSYDFIESEVKLGRQAYVICPLIVESESERLKDVDSVDETLKEMQSYFGTKPIKIGVVNGKMKPEQVNEEIAKFYKKEYDVLISTTIVEVGVNVPNATVIFIKNAERFGLAQLHQLRGRVGRGSHQSYCLLYTPKANVERLDIMTKTNNGFVIAEKDLELRGMGDFIGTNQTGNYKNVMLMLSNKPLFERIKKTVSEILKDPVQKKKYEFLLIERDDEEDEMTI